MNNQTKPFWETGLNPITMFTGISNQSRVQNSNNRFKGNYLDKGEIDNYVSGDFLMKQFGVGSKKIKSLLATIGLKPKYNNNKTYYNNTNFDLIKQVLSPKEKLKIDKEKYISNQELIKMFGFSEFKAWDISKKEKLPKKTFGRAIHYEREKAIEVFSKYKKY